jgi:anti-sigma-K factor RskA
VNCQEIQDLLPVYAMDALRAQGADVAGPSPAGMRAAQSAVADALEAPEREAIEAHLATGCTACAAALAEAQAMIGQIGLTLDPVEPPAYLLPKLMKQIEQASNHDEKSGASSLPIQQWSGAGRSGAFAGWVIFGAVIAAGLAMFLTHRVMMQTVDDQQRAIASLNMQVKTRDMLLQMQAETYEAKLQQAQQKSQAVQVALDETTHWLNQPSFSLASVPKNGAAAGKVYVDKQSSQWMLATSNLPKLSPGKTYELWFLPASGAPVRAGIFDVNANGSGTVIVNVPDNIGPIAKAAVTDEPAGGTSAPTGSLQIAGAVGS